MNHEKNTTNKFWRKALALCGLFLIALSGSLAAQMPNIFVDKYVAAYPEMPFDLAAMNAAGYDRLSIWQEEYTRGEGDESGATWSVPKQATYNVFTAILGGKVIQNVTYYAPENVRLRRLDYYYLNGLLSAIDEMHFENGENDDLAWTNIFFYESNGKPFQRVRTYPKDKGFREITSFRFDGQGRLVHQKTAYTGSPRHSQTLLRVQTGRELITTEYLGLSVLQNTYEDYSEILLSHEYTLVSPTQIKSSRTYTKKNRLHSTATYEYTDGKLTKIVSELHHLHAEQPEHLNLNADKAVPTQITYFSYDDAGLLSRIITEKGEEQTILNYNYSTQ
jgi:hypothetical protein